MRLLSLSLLLATPVFGETCPPAPDHTAEISELLDRLQSVGEQGAAQAISNERWACWTDAPDETAQEILDRGMRKRAAWDLLGAREEFDTLVRYCPEYAEGYNQRAFVSFLGQDYGAALPDLDKAIALSPQHVGALSGRALTLVGLGREAEAQDALAAALELNPWLPERSLYKPPEPKPKSGEEL